MMKKNSSPWEGTKYLVQAKLKETSPRYTKLCAMTNGFTGKNRTGRMMTGRSEWWICEWTFLNGQRVKIFLWKCPHWMSTAEQLLNNLIDIVTLPLDVNQLSPPTLQPLVSSLGPYTKRQRRRLCISSTIFDSIDFSLQWLIDHNCFIHNCQKLEKKQNIIKQGMDKQTVIHPYNGILLCNKKELTIYSRNNTNDFWTFFAERRLPDPLLVIGTGIWRPGSHAMSWEKHSNIIFTPELPWGISLRLGLRPIVCLCSAVSPFPFLPSLFT